MCAQARGVVVVVTAGSSRQGRAALLAEARYFAVGCWLPVAT